MRNSQELKPSERDRPRSQRSKRDESVPNFNTYVASALKQISKLTSVGMRCARGRAHSAVRCAAILMLLLFCSTVFAHEMRPAYLELRETRRSEFSVLWKTPMLG